MTARLLLTVALAVTLLVGGVSVEVQAVGPEPVTVALRELDARGIFAGTDCAPPPGDCSGILERWEAFVWMGRIIKTERRPHTAFADVPSDAWWGVLLQGLYNDGIVWGCETEPLTACPYRATTRAEMASLIVRSYEWPVPVDWRFVDIPTGWIHSPDIEALALAGITKGCSADPAQFCPHRPITRVEAALLLYTLLGASLGEDATTEEVSETDTVLTDGTGATNGSSNTGSSNTGSSNTGSSNTGSSNTGSSNTGSSNTGSSNTGSSNTGSSNTGSSNTGSSNTGSSNNTVDLNPEDDFFPSTTPDLWRVPYTGAVSCIDLEKQGYLNEHGIIPENTQDSINKEHNHHIVPGGIQTFPSRIGYMFVDGPFENAEGDWVVGLGLWGHRHFSDGRTVGIFGGLFLTGAYTTISIPVALTRNTIRAGKHFLTQVHPKVIGVLSGFLHR